MIWYSLFIPLIISLVGWIFFHKKVTIFELFLGPIICAVVILISQLFMKSTSLNDVEYNGYTIVEARYYEAYETWVDKTCSYTTTCCCNSKGQNCQTTTHYYDCSYCDYNSEYYRAIDNGGHSIFISKEKYLSLMKKWKATPKFVDLNRHINYAGGCGKDGDMYSIKWNKDIMTSETTTFTKSFTNILKCNHSAFNYPEISEKEAKELNLFDYPKIYNYQYQLSTLGIDNIDYEYKNNFIIRMNYLNGELGKKYKVRLYTLFFVDKDIDIAFKQEAYWSGGNQNEIVVCIGVDKKGNLQWVKPFSWCDNKRVLVDIREDIMSLKKINNKSFYKIYKESIIKNWHYKSFKDFNYLSFEPTTGQLLFIYITVFIISIFVFIFTITNNIDNDY